MLTQDEFDALVQDQPGRACAMTLEALVEHAQAANGAMSSTDGRVQDFDILRKQLEACREPLEEFLGEHAAFLAGRHADTAQLVTSDAEEVLEEAECVHRAILQFAERVLALPWTTEGFRAVLARAWDKKTNRANWDAPGVQETIAAQIPGWHGLLRWIDWDRVDAQLRRECAVVSEVRGIRAHKGSLALKPVHIAMIHAAGFEPLSMDVLCERAGYVGGNGRKAIKELADARIFERHGPKGRDGFSLQL